MCHANHTSLYILLFIFVNHCEQHFMVGNAYIIQLCLPLLFPFAGCFCCCCAFGCHATQRWLRVILTSRYWWNRWRYENTTVGYSVRLIANIFVDISSGVGTLIGRGSGGRRASAIRYVSITLCELTKLSHKWLNSRSRTRTCSAWFTCLRDARGIRGSCYHF